MNTSRCGTALSAAFGGIIALALSGQALGVTLYDQRSSAIAGTWTGTRADYIGGLGRGGTNPTLADVQCADDFPISSTSRITGVTADFTTGAATSLPTIFDPAGGFLVEIFANIAGNHPAAAPTWSLTTSAFTNLGSFAPTLGFTSAGVATYSIDLSAGNFVLDPGTWWISVVPIDLGGFGQPYAQVGVRTPGTLLGAAAHQRAGGVAHGNGYNGLGNPTTWTAMTGTTAASIKEASFSVQGEAAPAPSTGGMVIAVGLWGCLGRRRGAAASR